MSTLTPPSQEQPASTVVKNGFSLLSIFQFLGASSIIGIITWSLSSYMSAKGNQQQQLNSYINTISEFMIQNNLDGQSSDKPQLPAVSKAAHGYTLNTLSTFDGIPIVADNDKKLSLLNFLYDSELIGFCTSPGTGFKSLVLSAPASDQCQPSRIKLHGANLQDLAFARLGSRIRGINLSRANLSAAKFPEIDLSYADLSGAILRSADFGKSILHGVNFSGAYLVDADLANTDISQSDLSHAQLCGADLSGVHGLASANVEDAVIDAKTQLPAKLKQRLLGQGGILLKSGDTCKEPTV